MWFDWWGRVTSVTLTFSALVVINHRLVKLHSLYCLLSVTF